VGEPAVLSLGKLAPGQQDYYLDTVAKGAEEYYTGAKEAPGEWHGSASALLGTLGHGVEVVLLLPGSQLAQAQHGRLPQLTTR